ncbi:helix-turn-helix domain-containing protein [Nonomuraea turcica]|uniref:helix-turn-helix domain-containing protein n=1 Tax=Nonomuraea sp. G32 TaxID=3067274 RepID=UPI00273A8C10|nr:helix-turn-helix transcriptional regulator [Nonomuraea sp. G32]MDP4503775.1 helix-turn-helix transcriptional regulator [Nonomuraea sp. G32]
MQRRILARELRYLRERASLTGDDIKDRLGWSPSKISRIENARISVSEEDIRLLLDLYDATPVQRKRLLALAGQTQTPHSWRAWPAATREFLSFLDVEAVAESIRQWEINVVPGIAQTEAYARHLITSWREVDPTLTPRQVEERLSIRMNRQKRFLPPESSQIWIILDESVLLRTVGSPAIMSEQMSRLVDFSDLPNVTLQVVPLAHPHGIVEESFTLLNLDKSDRLEQCLVYIDHNVTSQFLLDEQRSILFEKMFELLAGYALSPAASREVIRRLVNS